MPIEIKRILCPTDFSESAEHALQYALSLAGVYEAEIELLHVTELPAYPLNDELGSGPFDAAEIVKELETIAKKRISEKMDELRAVYPKVIGKVTGGTPFLEIIRTARDDKADLIVMGTHGRSGLVHVMMGSVAEKVARKAPCPVLTARHPRHEFVMP